MDKPILLYDDDNPEGRELPFVWEICDRCEGHGKSSAHLGAFTHRQMSDDPEFAEDYMAGRYDRACETCGGSGKVREVDENKCSPEDLEAYQEQERDARDCDEIHRQERLMEGGWREEGWFDD